MSLTPVDESGSERRVDEEQDREADSASVIGRAVGRVGSACRSLGRALRNCLPSTDRSRRRRDYDTRGWDHRSDASSATKPVRYATLGDDLFEESPDRSTGRPDGEDRTGGSGLRPREADDRDRPGDRGGPGERDGPDDDRPELTVRWDGDELTLSVPGDSDAKITSDVWKDVRR